MPITSNGWEDFWPQLTDAVKGVFAANESAIIENAEENPVDVLPVSAEDETTVLESYNFAVDETITKTVDDINDEFGGESNDVPEDQTTFAKLIGGFFILNAIKRAYERVHGAAVARQTQDNVLNPDNRTEAINSAVNTGNNQIDVVTRNEIGQTYSDAARSQFEARGEDNFTWIHSGAEHPRQDHIAIDGQVFTWAEGAPVEGTFPGVAFNCGCYAISAENVQNRSRSKIMNNKIFNLAVNDGVAEIYMNGIIGYYDIWNDEGVVFNEFKRELDVAVQSEKTRLIINSVGGYVYDGIAMRQLIKRMSQNNDIEIHVEGQAASIASVIMLSVPFEKRFIAQGSAVMVHDPALCACGGRKEFESAIAEFDVVADSIAGIYSEETELSKDAALEMMSAETYFSADEAVTNGFANLSDSKPVTNDIQNIKSFVRNVRKTCSVEQKGAMNNWLNYDDAKSKVKPANEGTDMSAEDLKALTDRVAKMEDDQKAKDAKLEVVENSLAEMVVERDTAIAERDDALGKIESATNDALENVKSDMAEANAARASAEKAGFKNVGGDTLLQVQQSVLTLAKVSNPEKFEGDQMVSMFDFVLNSKKASQSGADEHDDGFEGTVNKDEVKFVRPAPKKGK